MSSNSLPKNWDKWARRAWRSLRIKAGFDYWEKYHELYLKGEFNTENKKRFLKQWFKNSVGYFPDIENPKTFNEKVLWCKLYNNDPLIAKCIDKVTFKDYIRETLGSEYVIPLLGVYSNADEIDFDALPNQFVIKANYGAGGHEVIIVADKTKLDILGTRKTISSWQKGWWLIGYKFVQPKILSEEYIEQIDGQVYDYKFWCFNGEPKFISVNTDRFKELRLDFFDLNWKRQDFTFEGYPNSGKEIAKPKDFSRMIELSKRLSKPFPFVRVDFYDLEDKIYIGELTFDPGFGLHLFNPKEWDLKFGEMIKLPEKKIDLANN